MITRAELHLAKFPSLAEAASLRLLAEDDPSLTTPDDCRRRLAMLDARERALLEEAGKTRSLLLDCLNQVASRVPL